MFCRACNTRIEEAGNNCPHCGARLALQRSAAAQSESQFPLAPSRASEPVDIELQDEVVEAPRPRRRKVVGRPGGASASLHTGRSSAEGRNSAEPRASSSGAGLEPAAVRDLIVAEPEVLEPGLEVYEESGQAVGAGFTTEVGSIDLLARDAAGALVVVMVAEGEPGREFVSNALERVGWVRKHKSKSGQPVRGIVLAERFGEDLGYAAAAVADTLQFRSWRIQIAFETVSV